VTASIENTPLTDINVSVDSPVPDGTSSAIDCKRGSTVVASGTTAADGDGSAVASNLKPATYVCTIVVDP